MLRQRRVLNRPRSVSRRVRKSGPPGSCVGKLLRADGGTSSLGEVQQQKATEETERPHEGIWNSVLRSPRVLSSPTKESGTPRRNQPLEEHCRPSRQFFATLAPSGKNELEVEGKRPPKPRRSPAHQRFACNDAYALSCGQSEARPRWVAFVHPSRSSVLRGLHFYFNRS